MGHHKAPGVAICSNSPRIVLFIHVALESVVILILLTFKSILVWMQNYRCVLMMVNDRGSESSLTAVKSTEKISIATKNLEN